MIYNSNYELTVFFDYWKKTHKYLLQLDVVNAPDG